MKHLLRSLGASLILTLVVVTFAALTHPIQSHAQSPSPTPPTTVTLPDNSTSVTQGPVACGIELTTGTDCAVSSKSGEGQVIGIIKQIINVMSVLVGAICVIMIIFGGFRYMISGGDSSGVSNAKNTILYAVVGLIIVILAQAIVRFVFTQTTKANS